MTPPAPGRSPLRAIATMAAGMAVMTLSDAVAKLLVAEYPIGQVIALRHLAALFVIVPWAMLGPGMAALRAHSAAAQLARGLLFAATVWLIVLGLSLLPLATVTALVFLSPVFVALLAVPVLGERAEPRHWTAIALGFAGAMVIVRPGGTAFEWALLVPLVNAFCNGMRDVVTRRIAQRETTVAVLFWSSVIVMATGFATMPLGWRAVDAGAAAWFVLSGALNVFAHFLVIEALRMGEAAVVAPVRYLALVWAVLIGYAVWGHVPDAWTLAGAALIVAGGIHLLRGERRSR